MTTTKTEHTPQLRPPAYIGYCAGDDGRVYSGLGWRGRDGRYAITPIPNGKGYLKIRLKTTKGRKNIVVHVLIAQGWLPPRPSPQHEVRHLDGDRANNAPSNLCWGTRLENAADRERHGRTSRGPMHSEYIKCGLARRAS